MVFRNPLARNYDARESSTFSVSKDLAFKILNRRWVQKNSTKSYGESLENQTVKKKKIQAAVLMPIMDPEVNTTHVS